MKRYLCAALAAALLMPGLWAVDARAQDDDAPPPPEQMEHPMGGRPDGAKMADMMKKKLDLTDEQAGKLKDAMKAHGESLKPFLQRTRALVQELEEKIKSKASDAELQGSLDGLKAARRAMAAEHEKFQDSLEAFLTPTQRAKMAVEFAKRMRREHDERGPKGPPRKGPRGGGPKGGEKDDEAGE